MQKRQVNLMLSIAVCDDEVLQCCTLSNKDPGDSGAKEPLLYHPAVLLTEMRSFRKQDILTFFFWIS